MKRPVIGISGPDRGGYAAWWFAALRVRLQGGRALRITPRRGFNLAQLDAIIIGGGADIEPEQKKGELRHVREAVHQTRESSWLKWILYPLIFLVRRLFSIKKPDRFDQKRDEMEYDLARKALDAGLPVLGICRGAQLLNLVTGGTLHNEILEFYEEAPLPRSIFPVKQVRIEEGSQLARILRFTTCRVNALHHQAVDSIGESIQITAREDNGLVQAIESTAHEFLIGVQWHPEYLPMEPAQRRLFRAIVDAAELKKSGAES